MSTLQFKIDAKLGDVLTESENVILFSALSGNGVFSATCGPLLNNENGIILSDSNFIYPLGKVSAPSNIANDFKGVLGRADNVTKIVSGENWLIMNKIFAKLNADSQDLCANSAPLTKGIEIYLVKNESQLRDYCSLKRSFIFEESYEIIDLEKIYLSLQRSYQYLHPALLSYQGRAVGMISSNFYSSAGAMINMLFIENEFRRIGLASLLLEWYIKSLSKISNSIYLFYSPDNLSAKKLYDKFGFQEIDRWIMALKQFNS